MTRRILEFEFVMRFGEFVSVLFQKDDRPFHLGIPTECIIGGLICAEGRLEPGQSHHGEIS